MKLPPDSVTTPVLFQRLPIISVRFSGGRDLKYWPFIHLPISQGHVKETSNRKQNRLTNIHMKENIKIDISIKKVTANKAFLQKLIAVARCTHIKKHKVNLVKIYYYLNLAESKTAPVLLTRSIVNFKTANNIRSCVVLQQQ